MQITNKHGNIVKCERFAVRSERNETVIDFYWKTGTHAAIVVLERAEALALIEAMRGRLNAWKLNIESFAWDEPSFQAELQRLGVSVDAATHDPDTNTVDFYASTREALEQMVREFFWTNDSDYDAETLARIEAAQ
jgi:hypothetical protein